MLLGSAVVQSMFSTSMIKRKQKIIREQQSKFWKGRREGGDGEGGRGWGGREGMGREGGDGEGGRDMSSFR